MPDASDYYEALGSINGAGTVITGSGTFQITGGGVLGSGQGPGTANLNVNMGKGGLIDIENGTLRSGGWGNTNWTNNQASLCVGSAGMMDVSDGPTVYIDA